MKNPGLNKKIFVTLFPVAITCYVGIFLSYWNLTLKNSHSCLIPLIFLFCGLLCIILMFFMANVVLQPDANERKDEPPSQNGKIIFEPNQIETGIADAGKAASNLLRGLSSDSDLKTITGMILKNLAEEFEMVQGMFFFLHKDSGKFHIVNTYAYSGEKDPPPFITGEGLPGQAVADRKIMILNKLPDSYSPVQSGLGKGRSSFLYILPIIYKDDAIGVIEMATFREIDEGQLIILNLFIKNAGDVLNDLS